VKSGADGLVITGGSLDDTLARIAAIRSAGIRAPILIGGGVTAENVTPALQSSNGVVVSSALMCGAPDDLIRWDADACARFMDAARI
jgi:predicted TIM-barrel enzyme